MITSTRRTVNKVTWIRQRRTERTPDENIYWLRLIKKHPNWVKTGPWTIINRSVRYNKNAGLN